MAGLNASRVFPKGIEKIQANTIDLDTHTFRAVLVKSSFGGTTFTKTNLDAFDFLDDIPAGDRSDSQFVVINTTDIVHTAASGNVDWAGGTVSLAFATVANNTSCKGIVVFKSSDGTEANCPLVSYNHFASNVTADGGTVTVTLAAAGLVRASYSA